MREYWQKQHPDKPLFPDLIWSRPENKRAAGKLLIVGGNLHGFSAPAAAYSEASVAGVGTARVILPDALKKTVGSLLAEASFAPSTPSGSFASGALAEILEQSQWADGVLLAGDMGRNSETAIVLEKFISKYEGAVIITKDVIEYFKDIPQTILGRPQTTLVLTIAQLQYLAGSAKYPQAFTFDMDLLKLVETLHKFSEKYSANVIIKHLGTTLVAVQGYVSTTPTGDEPDMWRVKTAAYAAVWWLQNPTKAFEALTSAIHQGQPGRSDSGK